MYIGQPSSSILVASSERAQVGSPMFDSQPSRPTFLRFFTLVFAAHYNGPAQSANRERRASAKGQQFDAEGVT